MFVEAISAGVTAYDHRAEIAGAFASIIFLIRQGLVKVTVFGAGGTGKSTLGRKLSGEASTRGVYHVSPNPEYSKLEEVPFGKITVFPGQDRRRELHVAEFNKRLGANVRLLIHVVAYGYHSLDTPSIVDHKSYVQGDDPASFMIRHKKQSLLEEIKVLDEVAPLIIGAPRDSVIRLVTLVTKQDLWWHDRQEVRDHYTSDGAYSKSVAKIAAVRGNHFEHTYFSMSIEQLNLITDANEVLAKTAAGYDDRIQNANVDAFVRHFHTICGVSP
jgi:hypothetical protein